MKTRLLIILAIACLLPVEFMAAVKPARSPKDLATSGSNQPMRQTNTAPVLVPSARSMVSIIKPPPRAPWVISKSFQFNPVTNAAGYYARCSTNDGLTWNGPLDLGTNTIVTLTNIPPRRPLILQITAYDANRMEGAASKITFLGVSPSSWRVGDVQYYAINLPAGAVKLSAYDLISHRKTLLVNVTNQTETAITLQRPAVAIETLLVEVR